MEGASTTAAPLTAARVGATEWGVSENNLRARFYKLTRAGRKQLLYASYVMIMFVKKGAASAAYHFTSNANFVMMPK